jgi:hypothetical protein
MNNIKNLMLSFNKENNKNLLKANESVEMAKLNIQSGL